MILTDLFESQEIRNHDKLDSVLGRCIELVHKNNAKDPEKYGKVAACIIDSKNRKVFGINLPGPNGTRRHAERVAIDKYHKTYGKILPGAIIVTTLSPCNRPMAERDGPSCQDLLMQVGIEKVYSGYMDPSQHSDHPFIEELTQNDDLWQACKQLSDSFVHDDLCESFGVEVYPGVIPFDEYLGPEPEFAPPGNYRDAAELHDDVYDLIDAGVEPEVVTINPKQLLATQDWLSNAGGDDPLFDEYTDKPVVYEKAGKYYILDGHHRSTKALRAGRPISVYLFTNTQLTEAFNQPYGMKWEKSEYGDIDALARLPDGSPLSIMFNQEYGDEGEEVVQVEFYRNNSQEVTGEGDAQRVFATVLTAIQQYIKKHKPLRLSFSASKEVEPGQSSESRAKLYDRLVQRYAKSWGYRAFRADTGNLVRYELSRLKPRVAENFADGKHPEDKGDSKRYGVPTKASVSTLRKVAKQGGRKGQLAHWMANMKAGRAKHKK